MIMWFFLTVIGASQGIHQAWNWLLDYPLVNIQKTMENHHFFMGKSTITGHVQ